ncbi:MAG: ABC transporter ATP-binding protein [Chloroflexota bacterium]
MTDIAIKVENLGKRYRIGGRQAPYKRFTETVMDTLTAPLRRLSNLGQPIPAAETIWALKDVSFEVKEGEVVGIIGRNGAGKSTLLKILSRITEPTEGEARVYGRVGSLLEVGTGFHPELTGRENIYLNGAILGMKRAEIERKFDEIVAFAEIEKFLDTPVKRYSSGMYVRLAFAVAAHLEPEVLVVDEVLAVGDAAFQKKCLGKMEEVAKGGRTVLFVSHDMRAIRRLCDRALYLKNGTPVTIEEVEKVVSLYTSDFSTHRYSFPLVVDDVVIHNFDIYQKNERLYLLHGDLPFNIVVDFEVRRRLVGFRIGVYLKTAIGDTLLRSFIADWDAQRETIEPGRYRAELVVPEKYFMAGHYTVLLHTSQFGHQDYLHKHHIQHNITIMAAPDFNTAHLVETIDSLIILNRAWSLIREGA